MSRSDAPQDQDLKVILSKAANRALGGGLTGAAAMGIQVGTLMWLRTTMNYQYRHGTTTTQALKHLWNDGGVRRFYRGVGPALIQGPLSRFGDTAANSGVLSLLNSHETTVNLPTGAKTMVASAAAALWRIFLMPVDTLKTILQVEGAKGMPMLKAKYEKGGARVFYHGALAASGATFAGHFPWFFTFNTLNANIPVPDDLLPKLARNAGIGFCSSLVSDTVSNSIRVVKTTRQTYETTITYRQAVEVVVKQDGVLGLFGRGLKTRLMANAFQGMLFTVLWKTIEDQWRKRTESESDL